MDYGEIYFEVRGQIKHGFRLKLIAEGIGMFIDGFTATESTRNPSGYWLQPPRQYVGNEWKRVVEFNTKHNFWKQLDVAAVKAIEEHRQSVLDEVVPANDDPSELVSNLQAAYEKFGVR